MIAVHCDVAEHVPSISFPTASPRVMCVERTFWEKATAVHVFCEGGKLRGTRFSRHWYDIAQLDSAGHVESALRDRQTAFYSTSPGLFRTFLRSAGQSRSAPTRLPKASRW